MNASYHFGFMCSYICICDHASDVLLEPCTCQLLCDFILFSRFQVYKARRQLAAVDWNYHVSRPISVNDKGEARHTGKYNQRTKEWNTKVVKVSKDFQYIPIMMAKIFKRRIDDTSPIDRHISMSEDDPARIAPTIAQVPPVSSKELFLRHQTRFSKCKTDLFSAKQSTEPNKE